MRETILIVDDESDILEMLKYNLEKEGYAVITASNGRDALRLAEKHPDLILLDVMLPELDGLEVCRRLKQNPARALIPVVFLTAKASEIDEVVGLELGAEDYITKPISLRKLIARVKAALRRVEPARQTANVATDMLRHHEVEVNLGSYTVTVDSKEVALTRKELETLAFLLRHKGRVVTREALLNAVWGSDVYVVDRTVDVHISKIRDKLGRFGKYIETVKGVGYRIRDSS